jgi:hypothetical protein
MKQFRLALVGVLAVSLALTGSPPPVTQADNAPTYFTPEGLAAGMPNASVRMADEQVEVRVLEQENAAVALVTATFDMTNDGPSVDILTGFPDTYFVQNDPTAVDCCFLVFTPGNITNFRAWTDTASYMPTEQQMSAGPYKGEQWFVWNMTYPQGKTLPVHVSYQQKLGQQNVNGRSVWEYVNVFYVLRTGALWSGAIGHAHIEFEAPSGGGFIGADGASVAATDHIVWDFTDFKPTADVGASYIFATPWKELEAAEAAVKQPGATPNNFLRAAQDALLLLNVNAGPKVWAEPLHRRIEDHYSALAQQWAANASVLGTADSWTAVGDADLLAWGFDTSCWPETAAAAYQHAADLGSDTAAQELAALHAGEVGYAVPPASDPSSEPSCGSSQGDQPGVVTQPPSNAAPAVGPAVDGESGGSPAGGLTEEQQADILAAVDRANAAWAAATQSLDPSGLSGAVAGQELIDDQAELDRLRSQGQTRNNINTAFAVDAVTLDGPGHATVRTHESWYAEIHDAASGRLLQSTPSTAYDETYTVEYLNDGWIVTRNVT